MGSTEQPQDMPLRRYVRILLIRRGARVGMIRRYIYAFAFILMVAYSGFVYFGPGMAFAQDPVVAIESRTGARPADTGNADRMTPHISVDSDLVLIPVMVTDHHDRLITGLEKAHFKLFED